MLLEYADMSADHGHAGQTYNHFHHTTIPTSRNLYAGNSAVYTVYVTAQSLDANEEPQAEIKVHATVERTWDGKTNFLDFKWLPSETRLLR